MNSDQSISPFANLDNLEIIKEFDLKSSGLSKLNYHENKIVNFILTLSLYVFLIGLIGFMALNIIIIYYIYSTDHMFSYIHFIYALIIFVTLLLLFKGVYQKRKLVITNNGIGTIKINGKLTKWSLNRWDFLEGYYIKKPFIHIALKIPRTMPLYAISKRSFIVWNLGNQCDEAGQIMNRYIPALDYNSQGKFTVVKPSEVTIPENEFYSMPKNYTFIYIMIIIGIILLGMIFWLAANS